MLTNKKGKVKHPSFIKTSSLLEDIITGLNIASFKPFSTDLWSPATNILNGNPTCIALKPIPPYLCISSNIPATNSFLSLIPYSSSIWSLKGATGTLTLGSLGGNNS